MIRNRYKKLSKKHPMRSVNISVVSTDPKIYTYVSYSRQHVPVWTWNKVYIDGCATIVDCELFTNSLYVEYKSCETGEPCTALYFI